MTVSEVKSKVKARELLRWRLYFRQEDEEAWKELRPEHWYLARCAYEVYCLRMTVVALFSKQFTADLVFKDFFLNQVSFGAPAKDKTTKETDEERIRRQSDNAKSRWGFAVGLKDLPVG